MPAWADDADALNFRAGARILFDDNLFRVPDQGGQKPQNETITTTTLGVDLNKRFSLQQIVAHVSWVDTRYHKFDHLNSSDLHYDGSWLWAVGSHLRGEVAADRSAMQNSFADFQNLRQKNLRVIENQRVSLDFTAHPSWHVLGGLWHQSITNDQLLPQESDTDTNNVRLGLRYTPASGNTVSWQARYSDGSYLQRPFDPSPGIRWDNGFTENGQELAFNWRGNGLSAVNGRLEYMRRLHDHFSDRDFDGWAGQLSYLYEYSGKTTLSATYQRGLTAFQEANSSYYVSDDLTLAAKWLATGKTTVITRIGYAHRQYRGEVVPLTGPRRDEDVRRLGLDLTYDAARWLELKAGLSLEKRDSNQTSGDYTDRQILLSATARF